MKYSCNPADDYLVKRFLSHWIPENPSPFEKNLMRALMMVECDPIYFDGSPEELTNVFDALTKEGFINSVKKYTKAIIFTARLAASVRDAGAIGRKFTGITKT